jgi:hypothetical protein
VIASPQLRSWWIVAAVLVLVTLSACAARTVPGSASPAPGVASAISASASGDADRKVCVDLDARGGTLYGTFVVPMMSGASGSKSLDIDIERMTQAVESVAQVGAGELDEASREIADEGERLVAAAGAFRPHDHYDGTALLTAFVGLAAQCQVAGYKPSWFDAAKLASN